MTPHSGITETPPISLTPLPSEDLPVDDWESQMAKLVGLEEESPDVESAPAVDQPSPETPIADPTEQPLSSNPFAKLALVGTGTLTVVLVAGVFLTQMMSGTNQKPKSSNIVASPTPTPTASLSPEENLQQEVETLKTKLALAEQAQAVKQAQQSLRNSTIPTARPTATPTIQTNPSVRTERFPVSQPTPRTVVIERIPNNPYLPPPIPVANSAIPQLPPPPVAPTATPSTPNPFAEWSRLAKLGSYGEINTGNAPQIAATAQPPANNYVPPQPINPDSYRPPSRIDPNTSIARYQVPKSLKVGTSAKGVLATAAFGETTRNRGDDSNSDNPNMFVVQLREPLKDSSGAIALPAKTELLTQVSSISEQGLVQMKIAKVLIPSDGNLTERDVPENALLIRAGGGRPLVAQQYPNRSSSIASMDAGLFVLGGIAKAAELYNRTDSQVTVNGGSTVVTNDSNRRNIAAGVLEGGLNSVVPQISQRNQQAIAQMMQQSNVWLLPAGTEVEIYVNQAMQF
ncbi:TrbI/VirB10 family protein [Aliinostoc sp. HNIBRCY26]|uniref:TrbI/VirB10 family protein n=1 Tax=Aliinostoc sp. HNIBRCY26 TaxID=3418997 RepID=UPI003D0339A6